MRYFTGLHLELELNNLLNILKAVYNQVIES
jgi:hypothetical protein